MFEPYAPQVYSDFSDAGPRADFEDALAAVASSLGHSYPLIIGGERLLTGRVITSVNPARPDEIVGTVAAAGPAEAEAALAAAWDAFPSWASLTAAERARHGMKLAASMRARTYELAALQCYEAGKNWAEAEADVAEAIDFCEYYARQAIRLGEPLDVVPHPGEENSSHLIAMGAGVVIPPWNFPLAILVGMAIGPALAGNTVVVKPASNTPIIGASWMAMVEEAGFPPGVVNFIPGAGAEVGDVLVDHPTTRFVNFTGSKEIGLRIAERAATVHPGQKWLKRAFMEMGERTPSSSTRPLTSWQLRRTPSDPRSVSRARSARPPRASS